MKQALLALEDGTLFWGVSLGAEGEAIGEVVFNTSLTGYQEVLTDPAYTKQIVTLTYPHIGSTGINAEDGESPRIMAQGLVVKDCPLQMSNFRAEKTLPEYLKEQGVVAIADIDTRKLTRLIRDKGAQSGVIVAGDNIDAEATVAKAKAFGGLQGKDLVKEVSTPESYAWTEGSWSLGKGYTDCSSNNGFHVVAYDFGIKRSSLRMLADRGCTLTVVPATTSAADVLALNPDGVFLSSGPGDATPCDYAVKAVKELLESDIPMFGTCLGHQVLCLASGAKTFKMKFGHHGVNHPVQSLKTQKVMISSQAHGFAVDTDSLPANLTATHKSLFDGSLQGVSRTDKRAFSFQGHLHGSQGPHDVMTLLDQFIDNIKNAKNA